MAFRADYAKTARLDDFFLFLVASFLVRLIISLVFVTKFNKVFVVEFHKRRCGFDIFRAVSFFFKALFGKIFGISAQHNIGASACHVRGDGNRADSARLRDDIRFHLMVFRIQYVVENAFSVQNF